MAKTGAAKTLLPYMGKFARAREKHGPTGPGTRDQGRFQEELAGTGIVDTVGWFMNRQHDSEKFPHCLSWPRTQKNQKQKKHSTDRLQVLVSQARQLLSRSRVADGKSVKVKKMAER